VLRYVAVLTDSHDDPHQLLAPKRHHQQGAHAHAGGELAGEAVVERPTRGAGAGERLYLRDRGGHRGISNRRRGPRSSAKRVLPSTRGR
jgi:hypothetical protein